MLVQYMHKDETNENELEKVQQEMKQMKNEVCNIIKIMEVSAESNLSDCDDGKSDVWDHLGGSRMSIQIVKKENERTETDCDLLPNNSKESLAQWPCLQGQDTEEEVDDEKEIKNFWKRWMSHLKKY